VPSLSRWPTSFPPPCFSLLFLLSTDLWHPPLLVSLTHSLAPLTYLHPRICWSPARVGILGWHPYWLGCSPPLTFTNLWSGPHRFSHIPPFILIYPLPLIGRRVCGRLCDVMGMWCLVCVPRLQCMDTPHLCSGWLYSALRGTSNPFHPRASLLLAREGLPPPLPLALALMHFHHCFDSRHSGNLTSLLVHFLFHLGIHLMSCLVLLFPAFFPC
jgi:hypothetical protein